MPLKRLLCFGDSIVAGSDLSPEDRGKTWPSMVETMASGVLECLNAGRGGRPSDSFLEFSVALEKELPVDAVLVALGTNDSRDLSEECPDKAATHLKEMILFARGLGVERILIVAPCDLCVTALGETKPIGPQRQIQLQRISEAFLALSRQLNVNFVSLAGVVSSDNLSRDGVHPNAEGNREIAQFLLPSLLRLVETTTNVYRAVPWRTLRLQPTPAANAVMPPDWALLDLFMAPLSTNYPALYQPQTNTVAGRINVNSGLPFTNNPNVIRQAPLMALFQGAGSTLTNTPTVITTNIPSMTLASGGTNYGIPSYISPGELAEIKGVSDGGETSETNLQNVVDLGTTKGGAFRIYSVGQALKQTSGASPTIIILSEQYKEATVYGYSFTRNGNSTLLWKIVPP